MKVQIEKTQGSGYWVVFKEDNGKGERIEVELTRSTGGLASIWKKHGFIKEELTGWWSVSTYVTDCNGNCWSKYNPEEKENHKLNFDWVLPDTLDNLEKIIEEVWRLANE